MRTNWAMDDQLGRYGQAHKRQVKRMSQWTSQNERDIEDKQKTLQKAQRRHRQQGTEEARAEERMGDIAMT